MVACYHAAVLQCGQMSAASLLHRALQCPVHSSPNLKYRLVVWWSVGSYLMRVDCWTSQDDLSTQVTHLYNVISSHVLPGFITIMGAFPGQLDS